MPTPTPRTDAEHSNNEGRLLRAAYRFMREHAEELERELATASAWEGLYRHVTLRRDKALAKAKAELAATKAELASTKTALAKANLHPGKSEPIVSWSR